VVSSEVGGGSPKENAFMQKLEVFSRFTETQKYFDRERRSR
jgi:hypothetical protein